MVLGVRGFRPSIGDLVKVTNGGYSPIAKGTISRIVGMSETGNICFIEEDAKVPVCIWDLELVAYRIGCYDLTAKTRKVCTDSTSSQGDSGL